MKFLLPILMIVLFGSCNLLRKTGFEKRRYTPGIYHPRQEQVNTKALHTSQTKKEEKNELLPSSGNLPAHCFHESPEINFPLQEEPAKISTGLTSLNKHATHNEKVYKSQQMIPKKGITKPDPVRRAPKPWLATIYEKLGPRLFWTCVSILVLLLTVLLVALYPGYVIQIVKVATILIVVIALVSSFAIRAS